MNHLSTNAARRYRRVYVMWLCCVPAAFLAAFLPSILPPPPPDWLVFVPAAWFFAFLVAGLVGMWSVWHHAVRQIEPDPQARERAAELRWFRPFGAVMAFNEIIRSAEQK